MNADKLIRRLLVSVLLGVVVFGAFVVWSGYETIGAELSRFSWGALGLALGMVFANYLLRFVRWEFYLARLGVRGVPKVDSFLTFFSGFVLTVTPGKVGEVLKSWVLAETHGVDGARTAPIVVAERLTDLLGIVVLVIVGSFGFSGGLVWGVAGAVAVLLALVVISSRSVPDRLVAWLGRRKGALQRLAPKVETAWANLRGLVTPGALVFPTLLAIAAWALEALSLWVIARGFGAEVSIPLCFFAYSTSQLAGALIPVPGGLGVTEGSLSQQLVRLGGIGKGPATGAMILIRLSTLWFAVLLGFIALALVRRRFPALFAEKPSAEGDASG